jgi:hypothetical protein
MASDLLVSKMGEGTTGKYHLITLIYVQYWTGGGGRALKKDIWF